MTEIIHGLSLVWGKGGACLNSDLNGDPEAGGE